VPKPGAAADPYGKLGSRLAYDMARKIVHARHTRSQAIQANGVCPRGLEPIACMDVLSARLALGVLR
jgi:hypothetical protein